MINPNKIENPTILTDMKNQNKKSVEYKVPFPKPLARSIEKFIDKFNISFENLFNYLLNNHFNYLHDEIKGDDNELLTFYYFCIDDIFSENNNSDYRTPNNSELNTQNLTVKINGDYSSVIEEICEEIYYKPEIFIYKAIKCQLELIKSDVDAGYYYIINDFCNVSRIKKALEKVVKKSKATSNSLKNEGLGKGVNTLE